MPEDDFLKGLNFIKQVAVNNVFNPSIVTNILKKKMYRHAINLVHPSPKDTKSFKSLTYIGLPSLNISSFFKNLDFNIAFKTTNTLGRFIKNCKDKTDKKYQSGVYSLSCGSCPKRYIGQTGRTFDKRINEHKKSFLLNKNDSNYANHLISENHNFNSNFNILHIQNKGIRLNYLLSLDINKPIPTYC